METTADAADPAEPVGTVLCIEDEPLSMELVQIMLSRYPGIRLLKAVTGEDGVRQARDEQPDLVLLDMHLPDMDGVDVVRALSEQVASGALRIVLVTADSFSLDVVKAMSLGAHEYWPKPLSAARVAAGLPRLLAKR